MDKEEYQRRYRQEHKAEIAEQKREYRQTHKEEIAEYKRKYRQLWKEEAIHGVNVLEQAKAQGCIYPDCFNCPLPDCIVGDDDG